MKTNKLKSNKRYVLGMLFAIVLLFATYSYATASTILSASDMKNKNAKIDELETEIAELEYQYFSILNNLSSSIDDLELKDLKNVGYASLDQNVKVAYNYSR